jgi:hypothetical protein
MSWKCQALNKNGKQCSRYATEKGCYLYCSQHGEVLDKTLNDSLDNESLKDLVKHYDNTFFMSMTNFKKNGLKK